MKAQLDRSHQPQIAKAGRYMAGLEIIGTKEAMALREEFSVQLKKTGDAVSRADQSHRDFRELKSKTKQADRDATTMLNGIFSMVRLVDPGLFAKLPDPASFPRDEPDAWADMLAESLAGAGKRGEALAKDVLAAKARRIGLARAYEEAYQNQEHVQAGRASIAEMGLLFKKAEIVVHSSARPGSPVYDLLKQKRGKPKAKKGASEKGQGGPGESPAGAKAA